MQQGTEKLRCLSVSCLTMCACGSATVRGDEAAPASLRLFRKVPKGCRRFRMEPEGPSRLWNIPEGSRKFKQVQEHSAWFQRVWKRSRGFWEGPAEPSSWAGGSWGKGYKKGQNPDGGVGCERQREVHPCEGGCLPACLLAKANPLQSQKWGVLGWKVSLLFHFSQCSAELKLLVYLRTAEKRRDNTLFTCTFRKTIYF